MDITDNNTLISNKTNKKSLSIGGARKLKIGAQDEASKFWVPGSAYY